MLTSLRLYGCRIIYSGTRRKHAWAKMKPGRDKKAASEKSSVSELNPWPAYIQEREVLWNKLKAEYEAELAAKESTEITVTLPDGKQVTGQSWRSTPYDIAKTISQGLADNTIIAKVNNELWDLDRPLESDCKLQLLKFDDPDAQQVFWHSSAHILGEAMERVYGGCLCYGPPIENGFYYDMFLGDKGISNLDFPFLESLYKNIVKEKQPFERLEMKKEDLLEMFKYNEFKVRILNEKVHTPTTTVYRCGPLIDLCRGPHIRHTGKVKAIKVTKNSSTYWEGNAEAESLQRVYGISFPDTKQLKEWEKFQEEAAKRDHRKIGKEQELFFFHELSPGSCFFQPRGAYIYNTLIEFIRTEYRKRGFQEVVTPNIYNSKLWQTSGHWQHYADNMFSFDVEKETFALKPMNCPGHCMIFDVRNRSWRELPLRMADFGVLHRNELSGALTGLTRVRRFQQDDAHIFCTVDQIKDEMLGALDFLRHVYSVFGFTFNLVLSTRPEKYLGDLAVWDQAEKALEESLDTFGEPWKINPQDGAFYGPKIDITIMDALKRPHQCATIQLDFQLPIRFNLSYVNESGEKTRPVIIHRAILGSVERMIAILTESYAGKWPFWLSPRQVMVIPVGSLFDEYAVEVKSKLWEAGFNAEVDTDSSDTLNKKIRNAQLAQFNFILVVGEKERNADTVNVRTRDNVVHGEIKTAELIEKFKLFKERKDRNCEERLVSLPGRSCPSGKVGAAEARSKMTAVAISPASHGIIQVVNENNLLKIESFLNDTAYREAIENSSNYNSRLCRERRLRMPFLDSQTGVAQNHSALFMSARERLPGLLHGQIYTYPSKRWRKKRRQYLMHYLHPKRGPRGDTEDGPEGVETITHVNDDSKESVALKDEHSKDAWYYDEQDMLDMDPYEEPDPDSDYDYEESYSSKRKRRKHRGGGHHPARSHPPSTDSPGTKRTKGGGRGRKKTNYDAVDSDKPFVCDLCSARYKTRPGLVYHYGHSHSTSSGDPAKELSPSPAEVEPRSVADTAASNQPGGTRRGRQNTTTSSTSSPSPAAPSAPAAGAPTQPQQQPPLPPAQTPIAPTSPTIPPPKEEHLPAVSSPGTAVPSPSSVRPEGGPPTPGPAEKKPGKSAQPSPYCDFCLGDARENKKTGGSEELVSCSDCGRSGHPTCLQFTANMIVSVRKYRWQCIECKCCSICGTSDNDDQLLFCDDCDRGYHMYCLSPPLASPPEGSWSCRLCIAEFHRRD